MNLFANYLTSDSMTKFLFVEKVCQLLVDHYISNRNISIVVSNDCLLLSKEKRENVEEINLNYAC